MKRIKLFKSIKIGLCLIIFTIPIIIIGVMLNNMLHKDYKEVRIPIGTTNKTLQAFIYYPNDNKKHDIVIYSHGSSGGFPKKSEPAELQAEYFKDKGYIVIVPMRKGRGTSDGDNLESEEKNPDISSWASGINSALDDISSAIEYGIKLPQFNKDIIMAGASRGGYLSVAYSAKGKYKERVKAVINFVGAWVGQKEDQCPVDFNLVSFEEFGKLSSVPNIWLYGKNDKFNYDSSILNYYKVFKLSNSNVEFHQYDNVPGNGHFLHEHKDIWEKDLTRFLDNLERPLP